MKPKVVRFVQDHVVKVVQRSFPLKSELVKCIETVKCKGGLWPIKGGREPARAQELSAIFDNPICLAALAIAEIDRYIVNA